MFSISFAVFVSVALDNPSRIFSNLSVGSNVTPFGVESTAAISFESFARFLAYKNIGVARIPEKNAINAVVII